MKLKKQSTSNAIRHRLLEGVLVRLARLPTADCFILRGGMLLRLWFHPRERVSADLDLVSLSPFSVTETERQLAPLLSDAAVEDGLEFNTERYQVQGIWLDTDFPGVRMFAFASVDGVEHPFSIDVTFGESLVPAPELGEYQIAGRQSPQLWMCRPEAIAARKLHALWDMGMRHWRPKDLNDIRLLLSCTSMNRADLRAGIEYSFTSRGDSASEARSIFIPESWWMTKTASARWDDFVRDSSDAVPPDLAGVVAEVSDQLNPILEELE